MKILYVITKSNFGGAQRYVFDLATHFAKEHDIVVAFGGHGLFEQKLKQKNIRTISLESLERNISLAKDIGVFFELLKLFRKERPDIIHLNSSKIGLLGSIAACFYKLIATNYKLKTIFTAHGWPFNEYRPIVSRIGIWILSWLTTIFSSHIIVIAQKEYDQAQRFPGISSKKITLIHNGVEPIKLVERSHARLTLGIPDNAHCIGTIAELHKNKSLETLIWACASLPPVHLVIIGDGEEKVVLEKVASAANITHIHFAGFKENAKELLSAFDIFALTSKKEGLPYVLLEAGMANLATVATCVGGVPEIIRNKETGLLVAPDSIEQVRTALLTLLEDRELRLMLGTNLHQHVQRTFNKKNMLEKTGRLYTSA